jgi:hypothetical protein
MIKSITDTLTVNGRSVWARPVGEESAEQRRLPESVTDAVSTGRAGASVSVGWSRCGIGHSGVLLTVPVQVRYTGYKEATA